MLTLRPNRLVTAPVPQSTVWLLTECMEAKGKRDLWVRQRPEVLAVLREQAIVQSTESSNRIEGVIEVIEKRCVTARGGLTASLLWIRSTTRAGSNSFRGC